MATAKHPTSVTDLKEIAVNPICPILIRGA